MATAEPLCETADALVIGGGPAGLMAAEALLYAGRTVTLAEAKPSLGRKFLMAGKSGLNLTRMQPLEVFLGAYGSSAACLRPCLEQLPPDALRDWAQMLGQEMFTGSTGRLFPTAMKASPLLRAWLARLDDKGLARQTRWRWQGWKDKACLFDTPEGHRLITPRVTVLALGGGSWARLGSDGEWRAAFDAAGLPNVDFAPSNVAISVAWSDHMKPHFGAPLKAVAWQAGTLSSRGEAVVTQRGLEGGGVYSLSPALRDGAALTLDLAPDLTQAKLAARLAKPRGRKSLSNHLRSAVRLSAPARAMLSEFARPLPDAPEPLAALIKALPIQHAGLRPLDEAISTTGGVPWDALDETLMLRDRPGTFCAGEMIDWDAPTGGYLLNACMATGLWAGQHAANWR